MMTSNLFLINREIIDLLNTSPRTEKKRRMTPTPTEDVTPPPFHSDEDTTFFRVTVPSEKGRRVLSLLLN